MLTSNVKNTEFDPVALLRKMSFTQDSFTYLHDLKKNFVVLKKNLRVHVLDRYFGLED